MRLDDELCLARYASPVLSCGHSGANSWEGLNWELMHWQRPVTANWTIPDLGARDESIYIPTADELRAHLGGRYQKLSYQKGVVGVAGQGELLQAMTAELKGRAASSQADHDHDHDHGHRSDRACVESDVLEHFAQLMLAHQKQLIVQNGKIWAAQADNPDVEQMFGRGAGRRLPGYVEAEVSARLIELDRMNDSHRIHECALQCTIMNAHFVRVNALLRARPPSTAFWQKHY